MSAAYRFCRTDDIPLLVEALNRCWRPYFPAEPVMTVARSSGRSAICRSMRAAAAWSRSRAPIRSAS